MSNHRGVVGCVGAIVFGVAIAADAEADVFVDLHTSNETTIEFTVRFHDMELETVSDGGRAWRVVRVDGAESRSPWGWPELPSTSALVGLPPDASIASVDTEPIGVRRVAGPPVAPALVPTFHPDDRSRVGALAFEPAWSDESDLWPAAWAETGHTSWVRSRRVATIHIAPARTVPGSSSITVADAVRVRLNLAPTDPSRDATLFAKASPTSIDRDPGLATLDARLVNGPESRDWLRSERPSRRARGLDVYFSRAPTWIKVRAGEDGLSRLTGADLEALGVSLASIDPATIRAFAGAPFELSSDPPPFGETPPWMNELAVQVADGGDGSFETGDRIEFFTTTIDGYAEQLDATGGAGHVNHQYTDVRTYWITWGGTFAGAPRRMLVEDAAPTGSATTVLDQVRERLHIESNHHYDPSQFHPDHRWEKWWWNSGYRQTDGGARGIVVDAPGHVPGTPSSLTIRFWGRSPGRHLIDVTTNTIPLARQDWAGWTLPHDAVWTFDAVDDPFLDGSNTFTFRVDPSTAIRTGDEILLAYLELDHQRSLAWPGAPFLFESADVDGAVVYRMTDLPASGIDVYDVTDPSAPIRLTTGAVSGGVLEFERTESASARRRYLVGDTAQRLSVAAELDRAPSVGYLRELNEAVDYIVVYADEFETPAETLADFRSTFVPGVDDPRAIAVGVSDVFDEFSWGIEDPTALRNFFKWAYEHYRDPAAPTVPRLLYVTLLGDADFDHRDFETASNEDLIPAWSGRWENALRSQGFTPTWPEDPYLALFEGPDEYGMDVYLGRMPAKSVSEATAMVDKTIEHVTSSERDDWQRRVVLVADDLCQGTDWDIGFHTNWRHTRQAEGMVDELPIDIEPTRIYLVDYPDPVNGVRCLGGDKPSARDALVRAINEGAWLVDYVGHGGETVMADERVLVSADIPQMTNRGRYHYFVTASCTVGKFDDVGEGLAETILKHEGGGSVVSYSAAAVAFSGANERLNNSLLDALVDGDVAHPDSLNTFGEAAAIALLDIDQMNSRKYNTLGDPATIAVRPTLDVALELSAADGSAVGDTLWRSERLTLRGRIVDPTSGATQTVDGRVSLRVLDSEEFRERQPTEDWTPKNYFLPGAPIMRSSLDVTNGEFETSFVVPSGLRRGTRGAARLRAYFNGAGGGIASVSGDAVGSLDSLAVPDQLRPEFALEDSVGPSVALRWEGPLAAVPAGSTVDVSLSDDEGIYITQLLDSRSAVLTFEDESGFVLEVIDLAPEISFQGEATSADLSIPIPTSLLANRSYVVKVRASDNLGNRTTIEETIYLVSSASVGVQRVFAYPNPATTSTGIFIDASRGLDAELRVYTVSGRLVRRIERRLGAGEGRTSPLEWNLRDEDGDTVANGSYHYLLRLSPTDGGPAEERRGWIAVLR